MEECYGKECGHRRGDKCSYPHAVKLTGTDEPRYMEICPKVLQRISRREVSIFHKMEVTK
jgi:hypothetical protein